MSLNNVKDGAKTTSVCGSTQDSPHDDMDNYYFGSQATYNAGDTIDVTVYLSVYHSGHVEFALCEGSNPTQACFKNQILVIDHHYNGGADPSYPKRGMLRPLTLGRTSMFRVQLPDDLSDGDWVMKMTYVTANTCWPDGYDSYSAPWVGWW